MTTHPITQSKYNELVAAIVRVVPAVVDGKKMGKGYKKGCICCVCLGYARITLEDVLSTWYRTGRAEERLGEAGRRGMIAIVEKWVMGKTLQWHLNNLQQTIHYLHSVLCIK